MRVCVIGTGYVGLVTGVCLAHHGFPVTCVDVDAAKVDGINRGTPPFHEPGLTDLLAGTLGKTFTATTAFDGPVAEADVVFVAVGTPSSQHGIDLTQVRAAAEAVGRAMRQRRDYQVVVVKSTVVPGTTERVVLPIVAEASGREPGRGFGVAANPEFLTEGQAVEDFLHPDRIVVGGLDQAAVSHVATLYDAYPDVPLIRTTTTTAEMIKYASNAMLACAISFANEVAVLCEAVGGVDVVDVMRGVHASSYLRSVRPDGEAVQAGLSSFFLPGCGFGGSCLPKDTRALIAHGAAHGAPTPMLRAVLAVNEAQPARTVELLRRRLQSLAGVRVTVLGLAFKPDTDDVRESPALPIVDALLRAGAVVGVFDPMVNGPAAGRLLGARSVAVHSTLADAITDSEALIVVTRWDEFRALPELLRGRTDPPVVVDGRRMLDPSTIEHYEGVGRRLA